MRRRTALLTLLAVVALAGCTELPESLSESDAPDGPAGKFTLLVTDAPADINDFSSLEVTFEKARIFPKNPGNGSKGFEVRDLDNPTVDLTEVVGSKRMPILETELAAGEYTKVELYVADINGQPSGSDNTTDDGTTDNDTSKGIAGDDDAPTVRKVAYTGQDTLVRTGNHESDGSDQGPPTGTTGTVDGETVDVRVPSGKLMITKPFEIKANQTTEFVFDIHVVKTGAGFYNLRPVISGSGVAGEDVEEGERVNGDGEGGVGADE